MSTTDITKPTPAAEVGVGAVSERELYELDVTGMTCGSCAARVQRAQPTVLLGALVLAYPNSFLAHRA
ncbi:MAG TPA: heavy metal-associated domain-containing protein [Solirubrobacteraceae bacterium]